MIQNIPAINFYKLKLMRKISLFLMLLCGLGCSQQVNQPASNTSSDTKSNFPVLSATKDPEMERFINDLLAKMTLEEKIGQLNLLAVGFDVTGPVVSNNVDENIRKGNVGGVFNTFTPSAARKLQEFAVNN
ncbi:MAG: hypothetical protein COW65_03480, partial [Cytophagales bacterium CG18_big_fil_WC_8_21_14_2_50_42_9]